MTYKLIEDFKKIIGNDPIFSIRAAMCPLFMTISWQEEIHPLPILCIAKGRDTYTALNEKEYVAVAIDKFSSYFNEKETIKDLENEYFSWEKETQQLYDEVTVKDLTNLSNLELETYIRKVNQLVLEMVRITLYIENVDYEKILAVIGHQHKEKLDAIWEKATESTFISFEGRQLKKLIEIVSSNQENKIRRAKFVFTDYSWTKKEEEISAALSEIKQKLTEKTREVENIEAISKERVLKYTEWLNTLDHDSRKIAEYAQLVMHMRDLRKDPIAQIQAMAAEVSVIMLERAGVDSSFAPFVILYEYIKGIDYLSTIKENIEGRGNGCIYIANVNVTYKTENCDFNQAINELTELINSKTEKTDALKGQIACRGNVRGTVRVIFDPHDDKGFQLGDILVTSMTRPEFVPLMKKA